MQVNARLKATRWLIFLSAISSKSINLHLKIKALQLSKTVLYLPTVYHAIQHARPYHSHRSYSHADDWPLCGSFQPTPCIIPVPPHARFHNEQTMSMGVCLAFATLYFVYRPASSTTAAAHSIFPESIFGSLYWVTELSAILYPGSRIMIWTLSLVINGSLRFESFCNARVYMGELLIEDRKKFFKFERRFLS